MEDQKDSLDKEKQDLENLLEMQQLQKQESESTKKTQESLLEKTKGKESEYQKLLEIDTRKSSSN